jgi:hypothetical protein
MGGMPAGRRSGPCTAGGVVDVAGTIVGDMFLILRARYIITRFHFLACAPTTLIDRLFFGAGRSRASEQGDIRELVSRVG